MTNYQSDTTHRQNPRILIVEDDGIIAHHVQHVLTRWGYDVVGMASSGEKALPQVDESLPDLVMMDIYLAGEMDGIETARQIVAQHDIPIIYLTAHPEDQLLQQAKVTGPYGYLTKPVQDKELRATIETALYKHQMERALRESEKRYRLVSELVSDFAYAFQIGPEGTLALAWITEAFTRITGVEPNMIKTHNEWLSMLHPNDHARAQERIKTVLAGHSHESEVRILTREGETRWLHLYNRPMWDEHHAHVVGIVGAAQDVTQRKEAEERAAHLTAVLRAIRNVNQLITHQRSRPRLLQQACDLLVESRGYHHVWIVLYEEGEKEEDGALTAQAEARMGDQFCVIADCLKADAPLACVERALAQHDIVVTEDPPTECAACPCSANHAGTGAMTLRLAHEGRVYGVISVSIPARFTADVEEQSLFREVAGDIAFALHDIEIEERRRQAEAQLRFQAMLLDQIHDTIVATDLEGRITYTNEASAQMLSRSKEELVGQTVHSFGENREKGATQQEIIDRTLADGAWRGQLVNYNRDGSERIIETRTWLTHGEDGAPDGMVGVSTEITEQIRTEEALRESEERYRRLVELSPNLVAIHRGGKFIYVNQAGVKLLGASNPDQIVGRSVDEFVSPPRQGLSRERITRLLDKKQRSPIYEQTIVRPDGTERQVEVVGIPFPHQDGMAVQIIARDVTEQKQAQAALRAAHRQLTATLNALPDVLFEIDYEGRIHDFRAPAPEALYLPPEAFLGRTIDESLPDEAVSVINRAVAEAVETGYHFGATYSLEMGGEITWFELSIARKNGKRLIVLARDVSERVRSEKEQARTEEKLRTSLQEKEVLIQELHHRVNNNLQIISAILKFQADASDDEQLRQVLRQSQNRIFALAHIHEHLYRAPNLAWIDMEEYIHSLAEYIYQTYGAPDVAIQINVEPIPLDIDAANPCGLIVNELLSNALQHAFPPGTSPTTGDEKVVHVTLQRDETADRFILTISDNGVGLPEGVDWRQPASLGLEMVKLLVCQLGGVIELDDSAGTTFTVRFPAA
jgi:PAS domain S-box-containing protein